MMPEYLKGLIDKAKDITVNFNGSLYVKNKEDKGYYIKAESVEPQSYNSLSTAAKILGYRKRFKGIGRGCD